MPKFPTEDRVLVTCGLPYANGPAHIGHLRTYIPADVFVRYMKLLGQDVTFVCGSDTHGTPIIVNAELEGISPKELVDRYHMHFQQVFRELGVEFDFYGSTDSPENHRMTQEIVGKLIDNGYIYPKEIMLPYCEKCDRFLPDRYVEGRCPYCGATARGDECDLGCKRHLEPGELKDPICKVCGNKAVFKMQKHYFFKLSEFRDFLIDYLCKLDGTQNARNYALEWVKRELRDWCITRNLEWGVKFPGSDDLVVYVWVDAPIGYITFTPNYELFWKGKSKIIHFIGSDIIYHHCIFWPAILKGAGLTLPYAIVASGMVTIDGNKFSKSRGYVVWVKEDYLDGGFDPDALRYYIASYTSHTKELDFSWRGFQEKINNELVGVLGNFIHRTLSFAHKNFGMVPDGRIDDEVWSRIREALRIIREGLDEYDVKKCVDAAISLASFANSYFQREEPWHLIKEDERRVENIIKGCLQIVKALCIMLYPVMPRKMGMLWREIGEGEIDRLDRALEEIPSGRGLRKPEILFEKIRDEDVTRAEEILRERIRCAE